MISPLTKLEFILGYAIAFGIASFIQATFVSSYAIWVLGLKIVGSQMALIYVAILDALLGLAMGLAVSTFAQTEFQALQFMPLLLLPQLLLSGRELPSNSDSRFPTRCRPQQ